MITTGGEGKVPPRKRLRGKIGNPSNAPEIKTHNLLIAGDDTAANFYQLHLYKGVYNNASSGVWYPLEAKWPQVGTSVHQRIGNKIRVRFLRLKGYVSYSPFLITQVRYRIVLYRTKNFLNFTHTQFIVPMYQAFANIHTANGADAKQSACVTDFYCSFFNKQYMKDNEIKRRVLFRGMIKPQLDVPNFATSQVQWVGEIAPGENPKTVTTATTGKIFGSTYTENGTLLQLTGAFNLDNRVQAAENVYVDSTTSLHHIPLAANEPSKLFVGQFQKHYVTGTGAIYDSYTPGNQRGFFPLDVTVSMNDNIDCEKYRYLLVLEADWCIGQDPLGNFSYSEDYSNFFISFCPHIYYTDD